NATLASSLLSRIQVINSRRNSVCVRFRFPILRQDPVQHVIGRRAALDHVGAKRFVVGKLGTFLKQPLDFKLDKLGVEHGVVVATRGACSSCGGFGLHHAASRTGQPSLSRGPSTYSAPFNSASLRRRV